ncbi:MAG: hypothetical protein WC284_04370 [Candidimonas sp.]
MNGVIRNKNIIRIDPNSNAQYVEDGGTRSASDRFVIRIDGHDRLVVDSVDRSGTPSDNDAPQSDLGRITIYGDFDIRGTTTTVSLTAINSENLEIADNTILVNRNETSAGVLIGAAGIEVERGTLQNIAWTWNEDSDANGMGAWWGPSGKSQTSRNYTLPADLAWKRIGNINEINTRSANHVLYVHANSIRLRGSGGTGDQYGTAAVPAYSWDGDNDTGMFRSAANMVGITVGGHHIANFTEKHVKIGDTAEPSSTVGSYIAFTGIEIERGASQNSSFIWDEANDWWGPYGTSQLDSDLLPEINGPSKTIGNVNEIDSRTAGHFLYIDANAVRMRGSGGGGDQYGTAAVPAYSWDGDNDTGMFRSGTNTLGITVGGQHIANFTEKHVKIGDTAEPSSTVGSYIAFTGIEIERGANPNSSFIWDESNGWWGPYGTSQIDSDLAPTVNGPSKTIGNVNEIDSRTAGDVLYMDANSIRLRGSGGGGDQYGSATEPSYSWDGDNDTGMFRSAANTIDFTVGGQHSVNLDQSRLFLLDPNNSLQGLLLGDISWRPSGPTVNHDGIEGNPLLKLKSTDVMEFWSRSGTGTDGDAFCFYAKSTGDLIGCLHSNGDFSGVASAAARYSDLAERYESDEILEPGDVVSLGGIKEITKTKTYADTSVFGVISTDPAFRMNSSAGDDNTHPYVALHGRVPVKVYGKVKKGDRLTSSEIPGVATVATNTVDHWAIIGRALEDKNVVEVGLVEAVVLSK